MRISTLLPALLLVDHEAAFPVISVNWDSWREVGMAANMAMPKGWNRAERRSRGFRAYRERRDRPQVIVSTLDLHARLKQTQEDLVAQPSAFATPNSLNKAPAAVSATRIEDDFVAPESELEKSIAEIWQSLLGMDAVGVHDNLFELGGDSLLGIQLLSRVRTAFGVDMHPAEFFRSPTVAGLAELVETKLLDEIEYS